MSFLKIFFKGKKKVKEYVYYFQLDTVLLDEKAVKEQENIRIDIVNKISTDLNKYLKKIEFVDIWPDLKKYKTTYILSSEKPSKQQRIFPVLYELYAYNKTEKLDFLQYPIETIIFKNKEKEIKVLKLEIEC